MLRFAAARLLLLDIAPTAAAQQPGPGPGGRGGQGPFPADAAAASAAFLRATTRRRRQAPQKSAAASSRPTQARRFGARKSTSTRAMRSSTAASRPTAKGATSSPRFRPDAIACSSTRPDSSRSSTGRRARSRRASRSTSPPGRCSRRSISACRAAAPLPAASPTSSAIRLPTCRCRRCAISSSTASASSSTPGASAQTDDLGAYRIFGLMPGDYIVRASMRPNMPPGTARRRDGANRISGHVLSGRHRRQPGADGNGCARPGVSSIGFPLVPARLSRISGTVMGSDGRPLAGAMVMIRARGGAGMGPLRMNIIGNAGGNRFGPTAAFN